jgi:hypothetical protein
MECWNIGFKEIFSFIKVLNVRVDVNFNNNPLYHFPITQYSTIPLFQHSNWGVAPKFLTKKMSSGQGKMQYCSGKKTLEFPNGNGYRSNFCNYAKTNGGNLKDRFELGYWVPIPLSTECCSIEVIGVDELNVV